MIVLLGTFDTKGVEYAYVRALLRARGVRTCTVDCGVLGAPSFVPDVAADAVAVAAGTALEALRAAGDRGAAVDAMTRGATLLVRQLAADGRVDGILALGGGGGTTLATAVMRALPIGVPKVMVSTMASGNVAPYVGVTDITMMYSVVDVAGLNPLSRRILANAAGAVAGMVEQVIPPAVDRPLIAASMFGVTTPCVTAAREQLEAAGYDVLVFHATGSGGRAMEGLIADGYVAGVLDVTTTEWADEVVGGVLSAGPARLSAAAARGTPQVVSVGALDMVNFGAAETVPAAFAGRTLHRHNATVTLMRTTPAECREIARRIAGQLNAATGPVTLVLPLRGVSAIDREGAVFHDPAADTALFDTLRAQLAPTVRVREVDAHINDPVFAAVLVGELLAQLSAAH